MKRRTLDVLFSAGGIALAGLLLVLGLVMTSNANFAKGYVKRPAEPAEHHLHARRRPQRRRDSSPPASSSTPASRSPPASRPSATPTTTSACTSSRSPTARPTPTSAPPQSDLRAEVAAAKTANDPALADLQKQLTTVTASATRLFKGETLRGLLLTSFGFSVFGVKGEQVATVAYVAAALLALLSIAGFVHAFRTPKDEAFAAPEHTNGHIPEKTLVGV